MDVKDLTENMEAWNPMEEDYKNADFNQYSSGPVAGLDGSLQPNWVGKNGDGKGKIQEETFLVLKNIPKGMTKWAVYNLCSAYGKVSDIRDSKKNPFMFVNTESVGDLEAIYRGLENNSYEIIVDIGKGKNIQRTVAKIKDDDSTVLPRSTGIDFENRTYMISDKQHARPHVTSQAVACQIEYKFGDDAHSLEREGAFKSKEVEKYVFVNGVAIGKMPEQVEKLVKNKNDNSVGAYFASDELYVNFEFLKIKPNCKVGTCNYCERDCDLICSRCSTFYCSRQCQKGDWSNHRRICGKKGMPKLTPISNKKSNPLNDQLKCATTQPQTGVKGNYDIPPSGELVKLISVSKANVVFIRSKSTEIAYFKIVNTLQAQGKKLKSLTEAPQCGALVIAKFKNLFQRAMVLNKTEPYKIVHIDYGSIDFVTLGSLYVAPDEFIRIPGYAVPVILKNVPDCYMTEEIRNFLYFYLNDINIRIEYEEGDYVHEKGAYKVVLTQEDTKQNINDAIIKIALPREPRESEICYKNFLEHKSLPVGYNIELIVMDNSLMITKCISCTTKTFALEIQKFHKDVQRYAEQLPPSSYAPRVDELCIVKYSIDGKWYRGRCLETVGDGYPTILFIDYGNVACVHISKIRRYPPQFTFPIFTADCEIEGLPQECSKELLNKLEELIPNGSSITCEHIKIVNDLYSIFLPNVSNKLSEEGLI